MIDLHMHTNYSDGELSPEELISSAQENDITIMAITDHDTLDGIKKVNKSDYKDISIINGIEMTAEFSPGTMHILGYGLDIYNKTLNSKLEELKNNRFQRMLSMLEILKQDYDIVFDYHEINDLLNANHSLGRPDLAKLLMKNNLSKSTSEAFEKYLNDIGDKVKGINEGISYDDCIYLIEQSGGIPVLAHPKSLRISEEEFLYLIEDMIRKGLMGIEVYHSSHSSDEMNYYQQIADTYHLIVSGGSDFHGKSVQPQIKMGTGVDNNLHIKKLSLLDELKRRNPLNN